MLCLPFVRDADGRETLSAAPPGRPAPGRTLAFVDARHAEGGRGMRPRLATARVWPMGAPSPVVSCAESTSIGEPRGPFD